MSTVNNVWVWAETPASYAALCALGRTLGSKVEGLCDELAEYDEITADNYDEAKAAVEAAKKLLPSAAKDDAEWTELQNAIADVEAAIADYDEAQEPAVSGLKDVKVQGVTADLTGGEGTEADPFTYVAKITEQDADKSVTLLEVVANSTSANMSVRGSSFAGSEMGSGSNGVWTYTEDSDGMAAAPEAYHFFAIVDGLYYEITCESVAAVFKVDTVAKLKDALNEAQDGDTIELGNGVYTFDGNLTFNKAITVKAADGADNVTLTTTAGNVITASPAAGETITLEGLKFVSVTGGRGVAAGGLGAGGSMEYIDCTFSGDGYGIYVGEACDETVIDGCTFDSLSYAISGVQVWADVEITNNTFVTCSEAVGYVKAGATGVDVLAELVAAGNTGVYVSNVIGYPVA